MRPRYHQLSPPIAPHYSHQVQLKPLPHPVVFCTHLLSQREYCLGSSYVNNDLLRVGEVYNPTDNVPFLISIFSKDGITFCLPQSLQYHLFRCLSGNTSSISRSVFHLNHIPESSIRFHLSCPSQRQLLTGICSPFHHLHSGIHLDVSRLRCDPHKDILIRCKASLPENGNQSRL